MYKCKNWKKERRFVAIRQIKEIKESADTLFPELITEYDYFCYTTDMNLSPWGAHKYYGKRSTSENWIEWCKNQMASGSVLTKEFWADSAIFQTCIPAYNLLVWMMWLNDENGFREEPDTIRMFFVHIPARLIYRGHQWFLRLNSNYPFIDRLLKLENSILSMNFN